jgi:hypothetical protein
MVRIEDRCCQCGLPCSPYCSCLNVEVHYCDKCGCEISDCDIHPDGEEEYCEYCYYEYIEKEN